MDVDGTLTDGKIYMGDKGEIMKAFDIKDGCGIKDILPKYDIIPVIITARKSNILKNRCIELGIVNYYQGVRDKLKVLFDIIKLYNSDYGTSFGLRDCAYIGDDILDLSCMIPIINEGGVVGCPADAVHEVKAISNYVCIRKAGDGAIREFIEWIIGKQTDSQTVEERIRQAIDYLQSIDVKSIPIGEKQVVNNHFFYTVQSYVTKPVNKCKLESHRKNIDIQIMIKGHELMDIVDTSRLSEKEQYDAANDVVFWNVPSRMARIMLSEGDCIVLYPENAHRGAATDKIDCDVLKIVGKVALE